MKSFVYIFLGRLWSKGPSCNFTEQLFFLQLWMATSDHLFNKCDQAIKQMKNQIITDQIPEKQLKSKKLLLWFVVCQMVVAYCTQQASSTEHITVSL